MDFQCVLEFYVNVLRFTEEFAERGNFQTRQVNCKWACRLTEEKFTPAGEGGSGL